MLQNLLFKSGLLITILPLKNVFDLYIFFFFWGGGRLGLAPQSSDIGDNLQL